MKRHFVISGCATDAMVPVVADEPALTVHSSDKDVATGKEHPLVEEAPVDLPDSTPLSGQNGVCSGASVKPDRTSYSAGYPQGPLRRQACSNAQTTSWTMGFRTLNAIIVKELWVPYTDIRP